jgi:hypothetical protein
MPVAMYLQRPPWYPRQKWPESLENNLIQRNFQEVVGIAFSIFTGIHIFFIPAV